MPDLFAALARHVANTLSQPQKMALIAMPKDERAIIPAGPTGYLISMISLHVFPSVLVNLVTRHKAHYSLTPFGQLVRSAVMFEAA